MFVEIGQRIESLHQRGEWAQGLSRTRLHMDELEGHASGEGELEEDAMGSSSHEARGRPEASLRERNMAAIKEASFPAYPAEMVGTEEDFELPDGFVDKDAPESARKWCVPPHLSASPAQPSPPAQGRGMSSLIPHVDSPLCRRDLARQLAAMAVELMRKKQAADLEPPPPPLDTPLSPGGRKYHPLPTKPAGHGEGDEKRMRRPTSIMRSNVEMARMMGVPGSKQRQLSINDFEEEVEQPQHLCSSRPRHPEQGERDPNRRGPGRPPNNDHGERDPNRRGPGRPPSKDRHNGGHNGSTVLGGGEGGNGDGFKLEDDDGCGGGAPATAPRAAGAPAPKSRSGGRSRSGERRRPGERERNGIAAAAAAASMSSVGGGAAGGEASSAKVEAARAMLAEAGVAAASIEYKVGGVEARSPFASASAGAVGRPTASDKLAAGAAPSPRVGGMDAARGGVPRSNGHGQLPRAVPGVPMLPIIQSMPAVLTEVGGPPPYLSHPVSLSLPPCLSLSHPLSLSPSLSRPLADATHLCPPLAGPHDHHHLRRPRHPPTHRPATCDDLRRAPTPPNARRAHSQRRPERLEQAPPPPACMASGA